MAEDKYDPDKDPIWLRRTFYRLFSPLSLSSAAAAAVAAVENEKPPRSFAQVVGRYRVCHLCLENLPRNAFDFIEDDHAMNALRQTKAVCRSCSSYYVGGVQLTHEQMAMLRTFAEADSDGDRSTTSENVFDFSQKHVYVIGKSGSGKTTFLKHLALLALDRAGFAFIDPHGDAVSDLLSYVPDHRIDDVIYFDPISPHCPKFNLLALPYRPDKLVADLVSLFKLFFGSSWGQQLEMVLTNSLATLIIDREHEPHSLADLRRLLVDENYRDTIAARLTEEDLARWWELEYPALAKTAANPVLNRLNAFMPPLSPLARLFSQRENDLDFTAILNQKKILLANLSKGELGSEPSRLLGGMLTASIAQAAMARSATPEAQRVPFALFADEFQTYVVESFEEILSQARKYKLSLVLANQTLAQLPPTLKAGIFGNMGALVVFCVSADDATQLKKETRGRSTVFSNGAPYDRAGYETKGRAATAHVARTLLQELRLFPAAPGAPPTVPHTKATVRVSQEWLEMIRGGYENKDALEVMNDLTFLHRNGLAHRRVTDNLKEVEFPRVEDFLTLRPLDAFARIGGADQVAPFRTSFLPPAEDGRRDRVLAHLQKKFRPPPATSPAPSKSTSPQAVDDDLC